VSHDRMILVVEDDEDIRMAMVAFLEGEGYRVTAAEHGADALRHLRTSQDMFCLVLLDLFMPVMNGWEFRKQQLDDPALASLPVVIVSADRGTEMHATSLGAAGSLMKPIDFDRLLTTVAQYC
jgi:CheY-like chemotaxis protein